MLKDTNVPSIAKAVNVIYDMSEDTVIKERARLREKALHDEASMLAAARKEGEAKGMEKGREAERKSLIEKLKVKGMTEEQIQALFE